MDRSYAESLSKETISDYNLIAKEYARTRRYNSSDLAELSQLSGKGEKVLDLGCANGRMFELFASIGADYIGVDASKNLIDIAKSEYPHAKFLVADARELPFKNGSFDKVYLISVLHNIPSEEFRFQVLMESSRVLKPEGTLIVRVWDLLKIKKAWPLLLKYSFLKIMGRTKFDFFDFSMPWKDWRQSFVASRYFHCFLKKEIDNLVGKSGFIIKKSWRAGHGKLANLYVVAQKP